MTLPDGVVSASRSVDPKHFDLESLPGGWVEIIEMPYGDHLKRKDIALRMQVKMAGNQGKQSAESMDFGTANVETTIHDFRTCIYRHNLGNDRTGRLIDFKNPADWMTNLAPHVGVELDKLIGEVNAFDEENFMPPLSDTPLPDQDQVTNNSAPN